MEIHSNLDLGAVNLSVYLDLVAICLITEILLMKNSKFKRFRPILPKFQTLDLGVVLFINFWSIFEDFLIEFHRISINFASAWDFGAKI